MTLFTTKKKWSWSILLHDHKHWMNFCCGRLPAIFPQTSNHPQLLGVFTYLFFIILLYLFIKKLGEGYAWSSLLLRLFSNCREQGLLSSCSVWASHCSGFSYCRTWALECAGFSSCSIWAQHINPGIDSRSPALQADSLLSELPGKSKNTSCGSWALKHRLKSVAHGRSWPAVCGLFPDQGSNPCLLH